MNVRRFLKSGLCLGLMVPAFLEILGAQERDSQLTPRYMVDVERYRFAEPNVENADFYPIPIREGSRDLYLQALEACDPERIAARPDLGFAGPRAFMPVLVKFVEEGEAKWGEACVAMLQAFHRAMLDRIDERKWVWQFEDPVALIPIYRQYLIAGGAMEEDTAWFREMWLCYCRHLHVWDTEPVEWRGGCHRSMPEGLAKGLAAQWYPDIPEASH